MRIAIFTDTFLPQINGVTNTLGKMRSYMDSKGIAYRIFAAGEGMGTSRDGVFTFSGKDFFLYPECKVALPPYGKIQTELRAFQPDLIHLVTPFSMGLAGLKYAREAGIPTAASYHTNFPDYMSHYGMPFLKEPAWWYIRWFHSFASMNLCPSKDTLTELKNRGFSNLEIWGRGIDTEAFSPIHRNEGVRAAYGINKAPLLLYVGRLAPEKELPVLLGAVKLLNQRGLQFSLLLTGDGPSRTKLQSMGLENVFFAGYQKGIALQSIYASADVFVFPSSSETYGNVILEAMASGLPVVAPFRGGVKENLIHKYNGLAFKAGDSKDMAACVEQILFNNYLRVKLARNARGSALHKDWNCVFDRLFRKYLLLLQRSAA